MVERLRAAGAITIGKTNTPEFGAGSQTFNRVFGATRNPYDPSKTCGGSSGGRGRGAGHVHDADRRRQRHGGLVAQSGVVLQRRRHATVAGSGAVVADGHAVDGALVRRSDGAHGCRRRARHAGARRPRSPIADRRCRSPARCSTSTFAPTSAGGAWRGRRTSGCRSIERCDRRSMDVPDVLTALGCDVEVAAPDLTDVREIFQVLRAWGMEIRLGELYDRHGERAQGNDPLEHRGSPSALASGPRHRERRPRQARRTCASASSNATTCSPCR